MEINSLEIIWSKSATNQLYQVFLFIKEDSPQNAKKVVHEIIAAADELVNFPERHPKDKFKRNNKGDYRALELHSIRIVYRITKTKIKILRLRHTSREPKIY
ncbi:MAG: hypothetical protein RIQ33_280 [Bacteroidota bacterium]|jgi:plasmid stabilization system protein ParE